MSNNEKDKKNHPTDLKDVKEKIEQNINAALSCPFGISYLDDALMGMSPGEVTLLGAATGSGKTEIATMIMLEQQRDRAKSVLYIGLDHEKGEIERRVLWQMLMKEVKRDPKLSGRYWRFANWLRGDYQHDLEKIMREPQFQSCYTLAMSETKFIYCKGQMHWREVVSQICEQHAADFGLFIIDHFHAMQGLNSLTDQEAAITAICNNADRVRRPVLLLGQFRKNSGGKSKNPIPAMDEFSGSSQLRYQPQNIIVMSPKYGEHPTLNETYFHVVKSRISADSSPFVGLHCFDSVSKLYSKQYRICRYKPFDEPELLTLDKAPQWANNLAKDMPQTNEKKIVDPRNIFQKKRKDNND